MTNAAIEQKTSLPPKILSPMDPDLSEDLDPEVSLDERIEVSPFLMLKGRFGSPIWIRKSAVVAVKVGLNAGSFQSIYEKPEKSCTVFADAGVFEVAHDALNVMAELGQGEL